MSYLLKINHCQHGDYYSSLLHLHGRDIYLVGCNSQEQVDFHKLLLSSSSAFLKEIVEDVPISELDTILLPDVSNDTLHCLQLFLYTGQIQCTRDQYYDLINLMHLLCIDSEHLHLTDLDGNNVLFEDESSYFQYEDNVSEKSEQNVCTDDIVKIDDISFDSFSSKTQNLTVDSSTDVQKTELVLSENSEISRFPTSVKRESPTNCLNASLNIKEEYPSLGDNVVSPSIPGEDVNESLDVLFPCVECDKSFSTAWFLQNHMEKHKRKKLQNCKFCEFQSYVTADFKKHNRDMHYEQYRFHCELCGTKFHCKSSLCGHKSRVHSSKQFQCSFCSYTCRTKQHLNRHTGAVHLNEKPFVCQTCGKCFKSSETLAKHERLMH